MIIKLRRQGFSLRNIYIFHLKRPDHPSNYTRDIKTWFNGMTPDDVESKYGPR